MLKWYSQCGEHYSTPHKHWNIPFFWPGCRVLPCPGHHWLRITINSTCQHCRLPDICCGIDLRLPNPNGGEDWNRDKHLSPWWKTEMRDVQNRRRSAATISEHLFSAHYFAGPSMETALISSEHLWYTVALGNCFHIDAESEPLWGYWANSCTVGHLLHGNVHGNKREKKRVYRRENYPPFTMTLITRKSISPLAIRRPSHVYGPSSVFFMPRIWRWLLLSSLNRTKDARRVKVERGWLNTWTIQGHGHMQG